MAYRNILDIAANSRTLKDVVQSGKASMDFYRNHPTGKGEDTDIRRLTREYIELEDEALHGYVSWAEAQPRLYQLYKKRLQL